MAVLRVEVMARMGAYSEFDNCSNFVIESSGYVLAAKFEFFGIVT